MTTYVSDYTFQNMSRIGNDGCCIDQNTIQNSLSCSYTLQNYFAKDCSMKQAKEFATAQPCVNYSGGYGLGAGGCNVDDSSKLLIGGINTNVRCKTDLFHRPFATVPYLGRGSVDSILESQLIQGEQNTNKRSVNALTEKSFINYCNTPLLPVVKENIQNPSNLIESVAEDGWIRGGLPSRELTKDSDFCGTHTSQQYV